jgi:osmotically-inducible protein OsmY
MKLLLTLIALGSFAFTSADQYKRVYPAYTEAQLQQMNEKYPQDSASTEEDRQLNAYIRDQLSGGLYDNVVIKTDNGVVVISGTLDRPEDVQKINELLKDIPGARTINMQVE